MVGCRRVFSVGVLTVATAALAMTGTASAASASFTGFQNVDHIMGSGSDPNFNAATGITDGGVIVGYAGDHATEGKPSNGWSATAPYAQADFHTKNVNGTVQTQLLGVNNAQQAVGFSADAAGTETGFLKRGNVYTAVPHSTQLLGVNTKGKAVGFFADQSGRHPIKCSFTSTSVPVCVHLALPGSPTTAVATSINDHGDIAGYIISSTGVDTGFVLSAAKAFWQPTGIGTLGTMILGINQNETVVGAYPGPSGATHGFVATAFTTTHQTVDDPSGVGTTVINGVNNTGQIVGHYKDSAGITHGFLAHA